MCLTLLRLSHVLIITSLLYIIDGTEKGCEDWEPRESNNIFCLKCKAGNRMVEQLGVDPTKLCTPCEPGTYTTTPTSPMCKKCTQCIGPQVVSQDCTASSDTVCKCKPGLHCGNDACQFCVDECGIGEEPTQKRGCRKCPNGTFNDKIHNKCKPWKSCPSGESVVEEGTASRDKKCGKGPRATFSVTGCSDKKCGSNTQASTTPLTLNTRTPPDDPAWILYTITGVLFAVLVIVILTLWFAYQRKKKKSETKDPIPEAVSREVRFMIVQDDACSFHQPEQEQGGSSESISTQDSESKLIV